MRTGTVCSFSGIYRREEPWWPENFTFVSFRDLEGTTGYCTPEARQAIRERLCGLSAAGIHLIDNGNYHYLTAIWLEKLQEPFDLAVFDHHTDMQPSALLPVLSCGNWILETLQEPAIPLRRVYLIGPPAEAAAAIDPAYADRVTVLPEEEACCEGEVLRRRADALFGLPEGEEDLPVYLSVDRDILAEEELKVNWDQGRMKTACLAEWIAALAHRRRLCGADLCGEPAQMSETAKKCSKSFMNLLR